MELISSHTAVQYMTKSHGMAAFANIAHESPSFFDKFGEMNNATVSDLL